MARDLIAVAPDWTQASGVARYGALAFVYAAGGIVVYFLALLCTHLAAFRTASNIRKAGTEYVRGIPIVKVFQQTLWSFKAFMQAIEDYSAKAEHYQADVCKVPQAVNLTFTEGAFIFLVPVALLLAPGALQNGGFAEFVTDFAFYAVFSAIISTALVGPSSGGKTTAASLIPRFWDVSSGCVAVGGVDMRETDPHALMEQVAFVFQNTHLFCRKAGQKRHDQLRLQPCAELAALVEVRTAENTVVEMYFRPLDQLPDEAAAEGGADCPADPAVIVDADQMIPLPKPVQHRAEIRLIIAGRPRQQKQLLSGLQAHFIKLHRDRSFPHPGSG